MLLLLAAQAMAFPSSFAEDMVPASLPSFWETTQGGVLGVYPNGLLRSVYGSADLPMGNVLPGPPDAEGWQTVSVSSVYLDYLSGGDSAVRAALSARKLKARISTQYIDGVATQYLLIRWFPNLPSTVTRAHLSAGVWVSGDVAFALLRKNKLYLLNQQRTTVTSTSTSTNTSTNTSTSTSTLTSTNTATTTGTSTTR